MTQRRAQVVRHGVGESLELLVARFELEGSPFELRVELADIVLPALPLGDVVVRIQDRNGPAVHIALQRPPACDDDLCAVRPGLCEFPLPSSGAQELCADLLERTRKGRAQKLTGALADGLLRRPPQGLLRAAVPVGDHVVHVADEDRVVGEIEQARLARELVAREAAKVVLDAPAPRGEPADDQREDGEQAGIDEVLALEAKLVCRRSEEIVDAEGPRDNSGYARPRPAVPDNGADRDEEKRSLDASESEVRGGEREGDGDRDREKGEPIGAKRTHAHSNTKMKYIVGLASNAARHCSSIPCQPAPPGFARLLVLLSRAHGTGSSLLMSSTSALRPSSCASARGRTALAPSS